MKEKLKEHKILLLIVLVIVTIILMFISNYETVESYLIVKGFEKSDSATYYKKLSKFTKEEYEENVKKSIPAEYDYLYFGLGTYHLSEEIGVYDEDVKLEYTGEYNYKTKEVLYSIRGEYSQATVQFTGTYNIDTQSFTCEPMLSYDIEYDEDLKDSVCELTKYHSQNLYNNSIELMNNKKMLNRIIRKTKD